MCKMYYSYYKNLFYFSVQKWATKVEMMICKIEIDLIVKKIIEPLHIKGDDVKKLKIENLIKDIGIYRQNNVERLIISKS